MRGATLMVASRACQAEGREIMYAHRWSNMWSSSTDYHRSAEALAKRVRAKACGNDFPTEDNLTACPARRKKAIRAVELLAFSTV